jgi:hypothetical protein
MTQTASQNATVRAVDFLASIGMGLLIATQDRLAPGMGFAVVADGPGTSRPLTLIGAADQINMHPTLEAALASTATGAVSSLIAYWRLTRGCPERPCSGLGFGTTMRVQPCQTHACSG